MPSASKRWNSDINRRIERQSRNAQAIHWNRSSHVIQRHSPWTHAPICLWYSEIRSFTHRDTQLLQIVFLRARIVTAVLIQIWMWIQKMQMYLTTATATATIST